MLELNIERLAYGGDAIAHLDDGRTVFVKGACPGDRVAAEITDDRDRFARARVIDVISPSASRVKPGCPYFGSCGGCAWQHVSIDAQLSAKRDIVVDALVRIGRLPHVEPLVRPTVAPSQPYGYRNKIELVCDPASRRLDLGFHRQGSDEVVPIDACPLLPKRAEKAPKALTGALRYLAGQSDLGLRRVSVRVASATRDLEIALWTEPGPFQRAAAAKLLSAAVPATSIVRVLAKGPQKERRVAGVEVLSGKGAWREQLNGMSFAISAPSFFQVNTPGAEALIGLVLDSLALDGTDRVVDLFAGAGTFTLPLAQVAGDVVAVESASSAVRDLRRNLEHAGVWADVVGGDAAREIVGLGRFDALVVDPPRAGLDAAVIAALGSAKPRVVTYVSCDPATLARDAARLVEVGYSLTDATPVDLFPQTYHVETVARFERGPGA
ncbi:MAG: 23S rRNA (uracil(1939)-C(5))-methyltransferase RlmD [Coriobacteriia bacterium]|nr:23S rRNA (uracil(1939)-C(5))-methyltransferase RlmD [Coriobacteriia bacterium]